MTQIGGSVTECSRDALCGTLGSELRDWFTPGRNETVSYLSGVSSLDLTHR